MATMQTPAGKTPPAGPPRGDDRLSESDRARLAHAVMRRQARLSVGLAALFLGLILGLPLVNLYLPQVANAPIAGGFTLSWLFLGVLFFPLTWALSAWFIRASDAIEADSRHWREVLGREAGEPLEPAGVGDVRPAFIADDVDGNTSSKGAGAR